MRILPLDQSPQLGYSKIHEGKDSQESHDFCHGQKKSG